MFPPPPAGTMGDPFGAPFGNAEQRNDNMAWRRRHEQQQRNLRFLMMFVMMLLLMEGEEPEMNDPSYYRGMAQSIKNQLMKVSLDKDLYVKRKTLDEDILASLKNNEKYKYLEKLNIDVDMEKIRETAKSKTESKDNANESSQEGTIIHYYPWNSSGLYAGEWSRQPLDESHDAAITEKIKALLSQNATTNLEEIKRLQIQQLNHRGDGCGLYLLEDGLIFKTENFTVVPSIVPESMKSLDLAGDYEDIDSGFENSIISNYAKTRKESPSFPVNGGKIAMQLFANPIPGMSELSFVDGFIKLYDGSRSSPRRDFLLRVRGVAVHELGKVSLVANAKKDRSVFYLREEDESTISHSIQDEAFKNASESKANNFNEGERRRKLTSTLGRLLDFSAISTPSEDFRVKEEAFLKILRDEALGMHSYLRNERGLLGERWIKIFESPGFDTSSEENTGSESIKALKRRLSNENLESHNVSKIAHSQAEDYSGFHAYPYIPDNTEGTEAKAIGISRRVPSYEYTHQNCEFEINLYTPNMEIEISDYENLLDERMEKGDFVIMDKDMRDKLKQSLEDGQLVHPLSLEKKEGKKMEEALIPELTGEIMSLSCGFSANVTVTAIRIDWESLKGKAINYSFFMMLICLAQIVFLLRQLLHTQAQSAATRVSLLCIGWQTLIDAIFCISHVILCLMLSQLLPAFSSVAFFKLLIFGVIEMKYMAIIVRARSNSADPNTTAEFIRHQVAKLQVQFYGALFLAIMCFWYIGRYYISFYVMIMYSFWVPQIVQNVITEAKRPLHKHYIYGMSITRLMAPVYTFAVPNNFWKTAYPDFESNVVMCELVVVWVGVQAAILIAQGKYGARFMIPARFLPPKYNYSRPIPASMLAALETTPPNTASSSINEIDINGAGGGTRNRINGSNSKQKTNSTTMMEDPEDGPTLDCVICYSPIDVHNIKKYMLAPCEHLFHRDCLEQWMDVKMECPICRKDLPTL